MSQWIIARSNYYSDKKKILAYNFIQFAFVFVVIYRNKNTFDSLHRISIEKKTKKNDSNAVSRSLILVFVARTDWFKCRTVALLKFHQRIWPEVIPL